MAIKSGKYPKWDEDRVRAAVIHYYDEQHYSLRAIAKGLQMSYTMVRRILATSPDVILREPNERTETRPDGTKLRRCKSCEELLPLTDEYYHRDKFQSSGFKYVCKDCRNQTSKD